MGGDCVKLEREAEGDTPIPSTGLRLTARELGSIV